MAGSYLLDSIAKGAQIGALGRKSYDARKETERKDKEREANQELATAIAEVQSPLAPRETTALPEPGVASAPAAPAVGATAAAPARAAAPVAAAVPEPDATELPADTADTAEFDALKKDVQRQSKRQRLTTADWAERRRKLLAAAAKTGDPDAVAKASKMLTDVQHDGFIRNLTMGQVFLENNQMEQARKYFEDAYEYFPDDSVGEFAITPDNKSILLKPKRESTGETLPMVVLNKDVVGRMLNQLKDPAAFAQFNWEQQALKDQRDKENARADRTQDRLEGADARAAEAHVLSMKQAKANYDDAVRRFAEGSPERQRAEADLRAAQAQARTAEITREDAEDLELRKLKRDKERAAVEASRALQETRKLQKELTQARLDDQRRIAKGEFTRPQLATAMSSTMTHIRQVQGEVAELQQMQANDMLPDPAALQEAMTLLGHLEQRYNELYVEDQRLKSSRAPRPAVPEPGASAGAPAVPADIQDLMKKYGTP